MKLRSEIKAVTASGSFWAVLRTRGPNSCLRRSRRLSSHLTPTSLPLQLPADPPSGHSRKRKACTNDSPPGLKRQHRKEDPLHSSETQNSDHLGSDSTHSGREKEIEHQEGSDRRPNDPVLEELKTEREIPAEERICCLNRSPSYGSVSPDGETEKADGAADEGISEPEQQGESDKTTIKKEREIPAGERICCLNRSPSLEGETEKADGAAADEGISEPEDGESDKTTIEKEANHRDSVHEEIDPHKTARFPELKQRGCSVTGPQLHFALERGYGGIQTQGINRRRSGVWVRDFAPVTIKGAGYGRPAWTFRRSEIVAGSTEMAGLINGKLPVVCLYDSMSLQ